MRNRTTIGAASTGAALGLLLALGGLGCGDGSTGPDEESRIDAAIVDDPGSGAGSVGPQLSAAFAGRTFDGDFSAQGRVEVSVDGQTWVDLGSMQSMTVTLQSGDRVAVHTAARVPARAFTRARLVLRNATATIRAGSTIGGTLIDADLQISIAGGGEFTVEKSLSLDLSARSSAMILFDLNSEQWIDETAVQAGAVTASRVQSATTVGVS